LKDKLPLPAYAILRTFSFMTVMKSDETPWMDVAFAERGTRRFPTGQTNPRIVEYNDCTNLRGYDDKISWCSSFVNWCLAQLGIAGTGSALARSWLEWGISLESPVAGCIAVLTRDDPNSWKGHVGFFLRMDGDFVFLFGGNQLEEVREHCYPVTSILSYRWPVRGIQAGAGIKTPLGDNSQ
jgi:uncharacterized protein (TIGR02594 family)